ncbi:hypothetical protein MRX96_019072 [Rhipicephalus microplus]
MRSDLRRLVTQQRKARARRQGAMVDQGLNAASAPPPAADGSCGALGRHRSLLEIRETTRCRSVHAPLSGLTIREARSYVCLPFGALVDRTPGRSARRTPPHVFNDRHSC